MARSTPLRAFAALAVSAAVSLTPAPAWAFVSAAHASPAHVALAPALYGGVHAYSSQAAGGQSLTLAQTIGMASLVFGPLAFAAGCVAMWELDSRRQTREAEREEATGEEQILALRHELAAQFDRSPQSSTASQKSPRA